MQALLQYDDTKMVTSSVLTIPTDQLISLTCDPSGSHIVDAFLSSRSVTLKKKNKLIKKFMVCGTTMYVLMSRIWCGILTSYTFSNTSAGI